jgi:phage I-like protein
MPHERLKEALSALHEELESGAEIEPADRKALLQTMREINEALDRADEAEEHVAEGPLSGRLSALIADLETSHPKFAEILRSVSESLANLGI